MFIGIIIEDFIRFFKSFFRKITCQYKTVPKIKIFFGTVLGLLCYDIVYIEIARR